MSESFDSFRVTGRQRLGFCLLKMFGTKLKTKDIKWESALTKPYCLFVIIWILITLSTAAGIRLKERRLTSWGIARVRPTTESMAALTCCWICTATTPGLPSPNRSLAMEVWLRALWVAWYVITGVVFGDFPLYYDLYLQGKWAYNNNVTW